MTKETEMELKVGLFVTIGIGLIMLAILMLGGASSIFTRQNDYRLHLESAEGLITGAKVVLGGLSVGAIESVDLDDKTKGIVVEVVIDRKYADWLRADSRAEIATQGLLGDKFIAITAGTSDHPVIPDGGEIPVKPSQNFNQFISKGDQLLVSLNTIAASLDRLLKQFETDNRSEKFFKGMSQAATNIAAASGKLNEQLTGAEIKEASKNLNAILKKINNGTGTLGALVNDPALYDDVKALTGGANRNRVMRNLVRKTIKDGEEEAAAQEKNQKKKK